MLWGMAADLVWGFGKEKVTNDAKGKEVVGHLFHLCFVT